MAWNTGTIALAAHCLPNIPLLTAWTASGGLDYYKHATFTELLCPGLIFGGSRRVVYSGPAGVHNRIYLLPRDVTFENRKPRPVAPSPSRPLVHECARVVVTRL